LPVIGQSLPSIRKKVIVCSVIMTTY